MNPIIIYCYDAYCGWCFGFSEVMKKLQEKTAQFIHTEVLSGGMIINETPIPISATASYIANAYKQVEKTTGVAFGNDYLWHILNPDKSDWFPSSEKPAIALAVFKELFPEKQVAFAADLQKALFVEGRDLCDDAAYDHLLEKYQIDFNSFFSKLQSEEFKEKAYYEFQLCKQLQVTGFPCVLVQTSELKFHVIARGYTPFEVVEQNLLAVLNSWQEANKL